MDCSQNKYKQFVMQILGARFVTVLEEYQDSNPPINNQEMLILNRVDYWIREYRKYIVYDLNKKTVQCVLHNEKL